MYLTAMRTASNAIRKQSAGVAAARIGTGDSPWRPYIAIRRSACSVLVGMPVEGPARWMSVTTIGSSTASARPTVSALRFMPGPLVVVMAIAPQHDEQSAGPAPTLTYSAWMVTTLDYILS